MSELETALNQFYQLPLQKKVKVDFDKDKKTFLLSAVIYQAFSHIPLSLETYVKNLDGNHFRPHKTSYQIQGSDICLIQEVPFKRGVQQTLRTDVVEFWRLATRCHDLCSDMAKDSM